MILQGQQQDAPWLLLVSEAMDLLVLHWLVARPPLLTCSGSMLFVVLILFVFFVFSLPQNKTEL